MKTTVHRVQAKAVNAGRVYEPHAPARQFSPHFGIVHVGVGIQCRQCGQCCLNLPDAIATCATEEDVRRWEEVGRDDILAWVDRIALGDQCVYDIWVDPRTGEDATRCPWLRKIRGTDKYTCRIHEVKPERCRRYPLSRKHAEETGCRGFEQ